VLAGAVELPGTGGEDEDDDPDVHALRLVSASTAIAARVIEGRRIGMRPILPYRPGIVPHHDAAWPEQVGAVPAQLATQIARKPTRTAAKSIRVATYRVFTTLNSAKHPDY
jgi:hypothetical protein